MSGTSRKEIKSLPPPRRIRSEHRQGLTYLSRRLMHPREKCTSIVLEAFFKAVETVLASRGFHTLKPNEKLQMPVRSAQEF